MAVHAAETPDDVEQAAGWRMYLSRWLAPLDRSTQVPWMGHRRRQCLPSSGRQRKAGSAFVTRTALRAELCGAYQPRMLPRYAVPTCEERMGGALVVRSSWSMYEVVRRGLVDLRGPIEA